MKTTKTPSTTASKSTKLTNAPENQVSTSTPQIIMQPDNSTNIGKQQRKSDFAEFKTTFLTSAKVVNRHPVNIEDDIWEQLERIARILGERGTTVASYINAVLADHLRAYSPDIEIWRKL